MTIIDKLKLSKYENVAVLHEPSDYHLFDGFKTKLEGEHDAIFIFIETLDEMKQHILQVIKENSIQEKGYLFFAYPKKGNKRYDTYIHRDEIFPALQVGEDGYVLDSELKFSRMVSMDEVFTVVGLKREKKSSKKSSAASQRVGDYEEKVKDVEQMLAEHPNELQFFKELTPGYQRGWARYLFSAKQQKTRDKRQAEMIDILSQGYKSVELYRKHKN